MPDWNPWGTLIAGASLVLSVAAFGVSAVKVGRELRIQLRAVEVELGREIEGLRGLYDQAMRSHLRINAALGRNGAGEEAFLLVMDTHSRKISELLNLLSELCTDHRRKNRNQLEDLIVQRSGELKRATALRDALRECLSKDDQDREWLRTHAHQQAEIALVATIREQTAERREWK